MRELGGQREEAGPTVLQPQAFFLAFLHSLPPTSCRVVSGRMGKVLLCATYKVVLLVATMIAVSAAPQDHPSDTTSAMTLDDPASGKFESRTRRAGRRRLYHVDVTNTGEPCMPNPLWSRLVDPNNYEFGCREIEVRICAADYCT